MIFIVDFGSQTAHLISRRVRELGVEVEIVTPGSAFAKVSADNVKGIILSGGPSSVYEKNAPTINPKIFNLGIPVLGICYGLQLTSHLTGGKVVSGRREYGPAILKLKDESLKMKNKDNFSSIISHLSSQFVVWMSHGDEVVKLPEGFFVLGSTEHVVNAFVANESKKIYGVQFHPEVEHTHFGSQILGNFVNLCGLKCKKHAIDIKEIENRIKETVGNAYVIGAVSGGVDSTVAANLAAKAVGKRFIPIYVENGLMREGTREHIENIFKKIGVRPIVVNVMGETLNRLRGISDPEQKRKIIGNFYIEVFEKEMKKLLKKGKNVKFLLQGTIYSDVIESGAPRSPAEASAKEDKGTKHASKIKSHHNVGGLPKKMKLKLLEPLRHFYKDEVREIGKILGLSEEFVYKQPFPGPGYAVRIRGEVTKERLEKERQADNIVLDELEKAKILSHVFLSFPVLTGAYSTAVKGDGRFFGEVVALRVVESKDIMTSHWSHLPYDILQKISSRIVNEVPGISRVVYDITTKPPATMEWE